MIILQMPDLEAINQITQAARKQFIQCSDNTICFISVLVKVVTLTVLRLIFSYHYYGSGAVNKILLHRFIKHICIAKSSAK